MNELKPEDTKSALECWASGKPCQEECSILEHERGASCVRLTASSALALLLENDAEIERLQNDLAISKKETKRYMTSHKQIRAEAITEFAEETIEWCRKKLKFGKYQTIGLSGKRLEGYEAAMRAVVSYLHTLKEKT